MEDSHHCLICTTRSDAHMWNLVFLQLLVEETGFRVTNLGICTPVHLVLAALEERTFDVVAVSTVNGHGLAEGSRLIRDIRKYAGHLPCVIGGMLTTCASDAPSAARELLDAGYNRVFDSANCVDAFVSYIESVRSGCRVRRHAQRCGQGA